MGRSIEIPNFFHADRVPFSHFDIELPDNSAEVFGSSAQLLIETYGLKGIANAVYLRLAELDLITPELIGQLNLANYLHDTETRLSGHPYVVHPLAVLYILLELMGENASNATLGGVVLHDVGENKIPALRLAQLLNPASSLDALIAQHNLRERGSRSNYVLSRLGELAGNASTALVGRLTTPYNPERNKLSLYLEHFSQLLAAGMDPFAAITKICDRIDNSSDNNSMNHPDKQMSTDQKTVATSLQVIAHLESSSVILPDKRELAIAAVRSRLHTALGRMTLANLEHLREVA